jgi:hypothetical protein
MMKLLILTVLFASVFTRSSLLRRRLDSTWNLEIDACRPGALDKIGTEMAKLKPLLQAQTQGTNMSTQEFASLDEVARASQRWSERCCTEAKGPAYEPWVAQQAADMLKKSKARDPQGALIHLDHALSYNNVYGNPCTVFDNSNYYGQHQVSRRLDTSQLKIAIKTCTEDALDQVDTEMKKLHTGVKDCQKNGNNCSDTDKAKLLQDAVDVNNYAQNWAQCCPDWDGRYSQWVGQHTEAAIPYLQSKNFNLKEAEEHLEQVTSENKAYGRHCTKFDNKNYAHY